MFRSDEDRRRKSAFSICLRRVLTIASLVLMACLAVCYGGRFDACAAITVFPPCVWLIPGLALVSFECGGGSRRVGVAAVGLWFVFLLVFTDTPLSLVRGIGRVPTDSSRSVRVISLNCASNPRALQDVVRMRADILLLQESPSEPHLKDLATKLYGPDGSVVWGSDTSIVSRGEIVRPIDTITSRRGIYAHAKVRLSTGVEVAVVSLRLVPSTFRLDLWSPDCWRDYTRNREQRRSQLRAIVDDIEDRHAEIPLIVGGDFNAPPGDAVFRLLKSRLTDSFRCAGVGWGNTIVNEWPILRIDQIWVSHHFEPLQVFAHRTDHSDHRMVVADLAINRKR